jgi:hypothetical protein
MAVLYNFLGQPTGLSWNSNGTPNTVVGYTFTPGYNGNLNGLYFYKFAGDTGAHTAFCWLESNQSLVGSVLFSGETASGWQYQAFSSPLALTGHTNYRVAVSHAAGGWAYDYSGYHLPMVLGSVMSTGNGGWYGNGSQTNYPNSSSGDYYGIDVQFDGPVIIPALRASQDLAEVWLSAAALRASQVEAEVWTTDKAPVRISQVFGEVWAENQPPTAIRASQVFAETWTTDKPVQVIVSQLFAEVWMAAKPKTSPRRPISSQVV